MSPQELVFNHFKNRPDIVSVYYAEGGKGIIYEHGTEYRPDTSELPEWATLVGVNIDDGETVSGYAHMVTMEFWQQAITPATFVIEAIEQRLRGE